MSDDLAETIATVRERVTPTDAERDRVRDYREDRQ